MEIRVGDSADVVAVLGMFDSAVAWLVSQGRTGQWGDQPFTGNSKREEHIAARAAGGGMRIAMIDGQPAGCLVVGEPMDYVKSAEESELYVQTLVIDQRFAGQGVGRALLARAYAEAQALGVALLRVDCYAGDDGRLVRYYESCGFTRTEPFTVGDWPGQILQRRVES